LLTFLGLREFHYLLDIGCGSLRGGKLFIPYLLPAHYFGIEPEEWLIEEAINKECGADLTRLKAPTFSNDDNFSCTTFDRKFDFILAHSIFSHASRAQIQRCISQASECMQPTSVFVATFVEGEKDYSGTTWVYPECVTYTMACMTELAEESGLALKPVDWPHPNRQTWILMAFPENMENVPDPSDVTRLHRLEHELGFCKTRLERLEAHPYVKFGLRMDQLIRRARLLVRRLAGNSDGIKA
jgi:hypothetical protein